MRNHQKKNCAWEKWRSNYTENLVSHFMAILAYFSNQSSVTYETCKKVTFGVKRYGSLLLYGIIMISN